LLRRDAKPLTRFEMAKRGWFDHAAVTMISVSSKPASGNSRASGRAR
jgi:hypothetical protein